MWDKTDWTKAAIKKTLAAILALGFNLAKCEAIVAATAEKFGVATGTAPCSQQTGERGIRNRPLARVERETECAGGCTGAGEPARTAG